MQSAATRSMQFAVVVFNVRLVLALVTKFAKHLMIAVAQLEPINYAGDSFLAIRTVMFLVVVATRIHCQCYE
jgi:ureidoglycolate hydrolase